MIQRAQNLYLFLAIICLVTALFLPLGNFTFDLPDVIKGDVEITPKFESLVSSTYDANNTNLNVDEIKAFEKGQMFPFIIITSILAALILLTIIKFKKLEAQFKLNRISLLISALILIVLISGIFLIPTLFEEAIYSMFIVDASKIDKGAFVGSFSVGAAYYIYFAATAFVFLAGTGIKKDIRLLKSIDRIR